MIADEKRFLEDHRRLRRQFGRTLEELEEVLVQLPPQKNNLATILSVEKQFRHVDMRIDELSKRKHQRYSFFLHVVVGIKALIFIGVYFRYIPHNSLIDHPSIYIVSAIALLLLWILYFSLLEKSYDAWFLYTVKPFAEKYPKYKRSIQWTAASAFNAMIFPPLM
ncbi:MAG: hypothetical protein JO031_12340, partial [Ktedonobacteraceae bacterium]|nr:hypothetical protein [Ktedonobacteraceae bacterium]